MKLGTGPGLLEGKTTWRAEAQDQPSRCLGVEGGGWESVWAPETGEMGGPTSA